MIFTYNIWLVLLSIAIAFFASCTSLDLASIVPAIVASAIALRTIRRGDPGVKVLLFSAIVMGAGIFVMHDTGMAQRIIDAPFETQGS